jgi:chaperonin GroEL
MKYLKDKIEDSVKAVKASIEEGIVIGGGSSLAKVSIKLLKELDVFPPPNVMSKDEEVGYRLVIDSLLAPLTQIATNAGRKDAAIVVSKVLEGGKNCGYDATTDKVVEDMIAAGIVDPAKVARLTLENAVSAAGILLTTEVAVVDIPEKA